MGLFTKKEKEVANRCTVDYLIKKNDALDRSLKYHAAGGDLKKVKEVLKNKTLYQNAMLCKYATEFGKGRS